MTYKELEKFWLAHCQPVSTAPQVQIIEDVCQEARKKGKDMLQQAIRMDVSALAPVSESEKQREYLVNRLRDVRDTKKQDLKKAHGLVDDDAPETVTDMLKRFADGKYTVKADRADKKTYNPMGYISWRDPAVKEDAAGYATARTKVMDAYQAAKDAIVVKAPADGLLALQAFETATFS